MISSPGQRFLSAFRSPELELCSLQGSNALSVSLSQSWWLHPHHSPNSPLEQIFIFRLLSGWGKFLSPVLGKEDGRGFLTFFFFFFLGLEPPWKESQRESVPADGVVGWGCGPSRSLQGGGGDETVQQVARHQIWNCRYRQELLTVWPRSLTTT